MMHKRSAAPQADSGGKRFRGDDFESFGGQQFFVEQRLVGWIIGRSGATLREIEQAYHVKVVVDQSSKHSGYSRVDISGSPEQIHQATDHINSSLSRATTGSEGALDGRFLLDHPPSQNSDLYEEMQIKQRYIGWLLGRGGGAIGEIEQESGCKVCINQDSKAMGYSVAQLHGTPAQREQARSAIEESIQRAKASGDSRTSEETVQIEQKWVGWLLGKRGGLAKEIEQESGANVTIDQSTKELGYSTVRITGNADQVDHARDRINASLEKAGAAPLHAKAVAAANGSGGRGSFVDAEVTVDQQFVGWLLGKGGGAVKEVEGKTGAKITVNQDTKAQGFSRIHFSGTASQISSAYETMSSGLRRAGGTLSPLPGWMQADSRPDSRPPLLPPTTGRSAKPGSEDLSDAVVTLATTLVENLGSDALSQTLPALKGALGAKPELAKALTSLASGSSTPRHQAHEELTIEVDQQWIGWLLGGRGKTVREIEAETGAKVSIDQSTKDAGYSVVRISGAPGAVQQARKRVQASLAVVSGQAQGDAANDENEMQVEQRYVGWILGKSGVVLREIQNKSGASVAIDQSTKDRGYSIVRISGTYDQGSFARRLIEEKLSQALAG
eukprot:TRINITY_DN34162_c0_g1_i1.p1 TRINITY_DN34162_c0_g1~~TRINITY_DN34162_c0_g1_i1.p1  ORF type:complete len:614 (-),score=145.98 TRINITY_DN34162_c0_g1_i1:105-1946(-)